MVQRGGVGLTGDGPQHLWDQDLHQRLVQHVVTVFGPVQHRLKLTQHHQAGFGETLLGLVVPEEAAVWGHMLRELACLEAGGRHEAVLLALSHQNCTGGKKVSAYAIRVETLRHRSTQSSVARQVSKNICAHQDEIT